MKYWSVFTAALVLFVGSACELESEDCIDAKRHLCENLVGQNCDTSTMDNAREKVQEACDDASSFFANAEGYCQGDPSTFSVDTCTSK